MNEVPKFERNLSLEQTELKAKFDANSARMNEIRVLGEEYEKDGRKFVRFPKDSAEYREYAALNEENKKYFQQNTDIFEYKRMAAPDIFQEDFEVGDISDSEKMKSELERVDQEIEQTRAKIDSTRVEINVLRSKMEMEESEDIPSLAEKKKYLESLQSIKSNLETEIDFQNKKNEALSGEAEEAKKLEMNFLRNSLEEVSTYLRRITGNIQERESRGYSPIFHDSGRFAFIASGLLDISNIEDLSEKLGKISQAMDGIENPTLNDDPDSLRQLASNLRNLESLIREIPARVKNTEQAQDLYSVTNSVAEKVAEANNFILRKAGQLEEYRNVRM